MKDIIPNSLRYHREQMGLRQRDVAEALGLDITDRISHWEKGHAYPSVVNLFKLSVLYRVAPQALYPNLYRAIANGIFSE